MLRFLRAKARARRSEALAATWKAEREMFEEFLEEARSWGGLTGDEGEGQPIPVQLQEGERVFLVGRGAALVEPRRARGSYQGGHSGISVRVAKGVRLYTGSSRGTYVQGPEAMTPIDDGDAIVTDRRVVFQGGKHARQWDFAKLIGIQHLETAPMSLIAVSNRQKISGILYDTASSSRVRFRFDLALAHYNDETKQLIARLETELESIMRRRPELPSGDPTSP